MNDQQFTQVLDLLRAFLDAYKDRTKAYRQRTETARRSAR